MADPARLLAASNRVVVAAYPCAVKMWAKGGRMLRRADRRAENSSALVARGNLLDEIDDAPAQF
jgi:hypothetical protein